MFRTHEEWYDSVYEPLRLFTQTIFSILAVLFIVTGIILISKLKSNFQAFYKDCGLSKADLHELYWDYKKMTKPDDRKLSERKRHEEYVSLLGTPAHQAEQARLDALRKGRHYEKPPRKEPQSEPAEETATRSEGARHLDLHCQV